MGASCMHPSPRGRDKADEPSGEQTDGTGTSGTGQRQMRVRFLIRDVHARGGTVRTTFVTAGSLARRGHDVEIVSVVNRPGPTRLEPPEGVTIHQLGRPVSSRLDDGAHRLPYWQRPFAAAPSVLVPRAEKHHGRTFTLLADGQLV